MFHFKNIQTNMNHANTSQARLGPQQTQFLRRISQFLKIFPRPIYWKWLYYNSHIQEKLFARKLLHVQTNLGIRFLHPTNMNINQRCDSPFSTHPDFLFSLVSLCMLRTVENKWNGFQIFRRAIIFYFYILFWKNFESYWIQSKMFRWHTNLDSETAFRVMGRI